ncbi:MAG TPA: DUF423 domain-containing protein [Candidatus Synoicihabitans sp.]|nr:DUF423 domain-containing protein [Candidatus Synoicihabitans sp.]
MRKIAIVTGLLGVAGVALGAAGAHAWRDQLAASGLTSAWETAVLYHLLHCVALLALSNPFFHGRARASIATCWIAGVLLFSGSLYALALDGPRWLGPVTPLGGVALILGWGLVVLHGWRRREGTG